MELFAHQYYWRDDATHHSYTWPAIGSDGYTYDMSSPLYYNGSNPALKPGALLVLPANASLNLTTLPAKKIAAALANYGGYIVDDTACNSSVLCPL